MIVHHLLFVGLWVGTTAFFTMLSVLNLRHAERTVEAERGWLAESLGLDDPGETLDYLRAREGIGGLQSWVTLGFLLVVLYSGLYRDAALAVSELGLGSVAEGVVFVVGVVLANVLLQFAFGVVRQFAVEEIFGFNEASVGDFLKTQLVGIAFNAVIVTVLVGGLLAAATVAPGLWWVAGVALFGVVSLAANVLQARIVLPLQYDTEPIEDGDLHDAVSTVFDRVGASCEHVYEVETSSHSSKLNALFTGFGSSKRVFLFDTLIEELDREELQSVVAHELGHWKHRHVWKQFTVGLLKVSVLLFTLWYLVNTTWLYEMFGLPQETYVGLLTGFLLVSPMFRLSSVLDNRLSYRHEYEADEFAVDVTGDVDAELRVLRILSEENLDNPFPHPWYAAFEETHPPTPERMRHVRERFDG